MQTFAQKLFARLQIASLRKEDGQTMAEYGVVLALITVGTIAAIAALALAITGKLDAVTGSSTALSPAPRRARPRAGSPGRRSPPSSPPPNRST